MGEITNKTETRKENLGFFFLLSFLWTWLFWIPDALGKRGVLPDNIWTNLGFFGAWGPLVAALIVKMKENGKEGVVSLLKKGLDRNFDKKWWVPIFLVFPMLIIISFFIAIQNDQIIPESEAINYLPFLPFIFFSVLFTSGPFQEEFGWRGYALPLIQKKYNVLVSSIILGFIWAVWHLPQFLVPIEKTGMFYITPVWSFILTVMSANIIYSWIFNKTNQSVLASLVLHTQMNLFFWIFPVLYTPNGYLFVLIIFAIAALIVFIANKEMFFKTSV
jgi:membrane protease YdiL (CAAX protease family)